MYIFVVITLLILFFDYIESVSTIQYNENNIYFLDDGYYKIKCIYFDSYTFDISLNNEDSQYFRTNEICLKIPFSSSPQSPTPKPN